MSRDRTRLAALTHRQGLVLAAMVALLLLMPVSYRAGAETAHPHAVFQVWIDAAHGEGHHHHPDGSHHDADGSALAVRETARPVGANAAAILGDAARAEALDTPTVSAMKPPLQQAAPLVAFSGLLVALVLLAGTQRRPLWPLTGLLVGWSLAPEPPPPRFAPLS